MRARVEITREIEYNDDFDFIEVEFSAVVSYERRGYDEFDFEMEYDVNDIEYDEKSYSISECIEIDSYIEFYYQELECELIEEFKKLKF